MTSPLRHACLASALLLALLQVDAASAQVLHDNGPLLTTAGNGTGGADTSAVQVDSGQTVTGYAASVAGTTRVADDFVVPVSGWLVSGIRLYGFQSGAEATDLGITGTRIRLWNAPPESPGSTLVFDSAAHLGDAPTVTSAELYRVVGMRASDIRRPIARIDLATLAIVLHGGTYWIDWEFSGARAAGPYVPPVTRAGQGGIGNAKQYRGDTWSPIVGNGAGEELPFVLLGGSLPNAIFSDGFEP